MGEIRDIRLKTAVDMMRLFGADIAELKKFAIESEEVKIGEIAQTESVEGTLDKEDIRNRIKAHMSLHVFANISEIHPAWLLDILSEESPRVVGVLLRYLPSSHVRYLIERLPKRIKNKLPTLIDAFAVPPEILGVIQGKLEARFAGFTVATGGVGSEFGFADIPFLKSSELKSLFVDIGIHELAMAFKGMDRNIISIVLNRLPVEDAHLLQQRIRSLTDVHPILTRDAKYSVLQMNTAGSTPTDLFFEEMGFISFAKALQKGEEEIFLSMKYKLEPRRSYLLRRYIDQYTSGSPASVASLRKELILERIGALSRSGAIDGSICRRIKSEEQVMAGAPAATELPLNPSSAEEMISNGDSWQEKDSVI